MSWDSNDALSLAKYLTEHPRFLEELKSRAPKIEVESLERTAMSGAQRAGAELIIKAVDEMATGGPAPERSPYIRADQD